MTGPSTITVVKVDGKLYQETPDGLVLMPKAEPGREMTEEEIYQAALSDPDNPPMTAEDWARLKPVPRVRTLRRALGMTQEDFAQKFHIPLGTLRDWEQGRSVPDQPAKVLLRLIAHDPEGVMATLAKDAAAVESA